MELESKMHYGESLINRFHISHRFLAQCPPTSQLTPISIERIINRIIEFNDPEIQLPRPISVVVAKSEPYIWAPWTDMTRAKQAYGDICILKLRRDLSSKHAMIVSQALCTLSDVLHNPERACEALDSNIHARFVKLLDGENPFIKQRTLLCMKVLATQPFGSFIMANNKYLIRNLMSALDESSFLIKNQAIMAIHAFVFNPFARGRFIDSLYLKDIIRCTTTYQFGRKEEFFDVKVLLLLLECLKYLIQESDEAKVQALAYNVLLLFNLLRHNESQIRNEAAAVFGELLKHEIGKLASQYWPFIEFMNDAIDTDQPQHSVALLGSLRFVTVTSESRKIAIDNEIIEILVEMVTLTRNPEPLLSIAQILINLAEHPIGRKRLQEIGPELMFSFDGPAPILQRKVIQLFDTIYKSD